MRGAEARRGHLIFHQHTIGEVAGAGSLCGLFWRLKETPDLLHDEQLQCLGKVSFCSYDAPSKKTKWENRLRRAVVEAAKSVKSNKTRLRRAFVEAGISVRSNNYAPDLCAKVKKAHKTIVHDKCTQQSTNAHSN